MGTLRCRHGTGFKHGEIAGGKEAAKTAAYPAPLCRSILSGYFGSYSNIPAMPCVPCAAAARRAYSIGNHRERIIHEREDEWKNTEGEAHGTFEHLDYSCSTGPRLSSLLTIRCLIMCAIPSMYPFLFRTDSRVFQLERQSQHRKPRSRHYGLTRVCLEASQQGSGVHRGRDFRRCP